jgi:uncharacterized protein (DUF4415 family)
MVDGCLLLLEAHTVLPDEDGEVIRIISARKADKKEQKHLKKTLKYALNSTQPLPLTKKKKAEIKDLSELTDKQIDYSDIPPLSDAFWKHAVHSPFHKPTKTSTTVRVDSDVLAWLKSQGKGYQTRINAILRAAMLHKIKP